MIRKLIILSIIFISSNYSQRLSEYVDPFIGTGGHGHTFPGATVPFGMVQLSPDTDIKGWDWCSGYHASDSSIMGFSHTHLSGTGASDYGDIMFMPTFGEIQFQPGSKSNPDEGYRSRFAHKKENAEPGYYSVYLDDYSTLVELTASERCGIQKYSFDKTGEMHLIIDLEHGIHDKVKKGYIKIISPTLIAGYRNSGGWAKDHTVYFTAEFSEPIIGVKFFDGKNISDAKEAEGRIVKAALSFGVLKGEELTVKVGISHVSIKGALKNYNAEVLGKSFDEVKSEAKAMWKRELSKIIVRDKSEDNKIKFYTALYRTMIHPNLFNDVDGKYMGMDRKVHHAGHNVYTVFSLWDTFRALHPLLTLIDKKRTSDFIKSMLLKYDEAGILPVWELAGNETWTMIGYHSVPVIVDAYMKDVREFGVQKAFKAIKHSAMSDHQGLEYYKKMGYVPMDKADDAVSRTFEYAYDDWCIAQMAKELKEKDDYKYFITRAQNYINVFDTATKFSRGRKYNGFWRSDFDPMTASGLGAGEFTEGNSWQYTWFVPQDVNGLIDLIGGKEKFSGKLDQLFSTEIKEGYYLPSDMSGLIGQYAHGNEPSHHIAYLYNFAGKAWKTERMVRKIMDELYTTNLNGFPGNEDCGQMSAWFVFSSIGFYPVTPGANIYAAGSPLFDNVKINLENGKNILLSANRSSENDIYIKSLTINGIKTKKSFIDYDEIKQGAKIIFEMSDKPDTAFGSDEKDIPKSEITEPFERVEDYWLFVPSADPRGTLFSEKKTIELKSFNRGAEIRFTIDGLDVKENSPLYSKPIIINKSTLLKARAFKNGFEKSEQLEISYSRSINRSGGGYFAVNGEKYPKIKLKYPPEDKYSGTGADNLLDGILGSDNFFDGFWNGFEANDIEAEIDLGKEANLAFVGIRMLERQRSWIFFPERVVIYFSSDGKNWGNNPRVVYEKNVEPSGEGKIKIFGGTFENIKSRFIRISAKNIKHNPEWHSAPGGKAWLFADEIIIKTEPGEE